MKKFNYYTLLLPVIIAMIVYWFAYEKDNYPTAKKATPAPQEIAAK